MTILDGKDSIKSQRVSGCCCNYDNNMNIHRRYKIEKAKQFIILRKLTTGRDRVII